MAPSQVGLDTQDPLFTFKRGYTKRSTLASWFFSIGARPRLRTGFRWCRLKAFIGIHQAGIRQSRGAAGQGVVSLSHMALPFTPDEPIYGSEPPSQAGQMYLGQIPLNGERGPLRISADWLLRLRQSSSCGYLEGRTPTRDGLISSWSLRLSSSTIRLGASTTIPITQAWQPGRSWVHPSSRCAVSKKNAYNGLKSGLCGYLFIYHQYLRPYRHLN